MQPLQCACNARYMYPRSYKSKHRRQYMLYFDAKNSTKKGALFSVVAIAQRVRQWSDHERCTAVVVAEADGLQHPCKLPHSRGAVA